MVTVPLVNTSSIPQKIGTLWIPPKESRPVSLSVAIKHMDDKRFAIDTENIVDNLTPSFVDGNLKGFVFATPISLADGYGQGGVFMTEGLTDLGIDIDLYAMGWLNKQQVSQRVKNLLSKDKLGYDFGIGRGYPEQVLHKVPTKHKLAHTMWECTRIHPEWVPLLNNTLGLIVPTNSQQEIFKDSGVRVPMYSVPEPVDTDFWCVEHTPRTDVFKIVSWSRMSSRKMPMEMLQVFSYTFPYDKYPDVIFELKTNSGQFGMGTGTIPQIRDPRIKIHDGVWPLERLRSWVQDAHVGFFLSHGEGMFVPPMQAMAMGIPCVVPDHSGASDYADARYNYPVQVDKAEPYSPSPLGEGLEWWNPSLEQASDNLLRIYNDYETAKKRGTAARTMIQRRYTVEAIATKLKKVIERYG